MIDEAKINSPRTALVTGGSRGIGAAIVAEFSDRGIQVPAPPRQVLDLSDADSINRYMQRLADESQTIDILVNNAGINIISPLEEISPDAWQSMLQTNLNAPF